MKFTEYGVDHDKVIILLHGGGLSDWSLAPVAGLLKEKYHVVTPILDGHGAEGKVPFCSIHDSAQKLADYIDQFCNGKVFLLGGLSIGAQIVTELLSFRPEIAEHAVIESALVFPIWGTKWMAAPVYGTCYGLIKKRWFARLQAKSLCVDENRFEQYYQDSIQMTKESLIQLTLSNGTYHLNPAIANTSAKVLIIVGGRELPIMKKSAEELHRQIPGSTLYVAENKKHGEFSLKCPQEYVQKILDETK